MENLGSNASYVRQTIGVTRVLRAHVRTIQFRLQEVRELRTAPVETTAALGVKSVVQVFMSRLEVSVSCVLLAPGVQTRLDTTVQQTPLRHLDQAYKIIAHAEMVTQEPLGIYVQHVCLEHFAKMES